MPNRGFHHANEWSERIGRDVDSKNSFDFESYKMMVARNRNLILVLSPNVIVRRSKHHHEKHSNDLEMDSSMHMSLEELLLFTTKINVLDVVLRFWKSYIGYVSEKCQDSTLNLRQT